MAHKHYVGFKAHKKVSEPVQVTFRTKEGLVSFGAHKKVEEPVYVHFLAKDK